MTTNNSTNYSVKELVAKYRSYVFENAPIDERFLEESKKYGKIHRRPLNRGDGNPDCALMSTLYKTFADCHKLSGSLTFKFTGNYYKEALSEEEFAFLRNHFSETINELFSNGKNWDGIKENYDFIFTNNNNLELVKEYLQPKDSSSIYLVDAGCDVAELYPTCSFKIHYRDTDKTNFAKIWLYSKKINANISEVNYDPNNQWNKLKIEENFNYIVCSSTCGYDPCSIYDHLLPNGRMLLFTTYEAMAKNNFVLSQLHKSLLELTPKNKKRNKHKSEIVIMQEEFSYLTKKNLVLSKFRDTLVKDKAISSIISFNDPSSTKYSKKGLLLVIEKSEHKNVAIHSLEKNQNISIASEKLDPDILWSSYYLTSKPAKGKKLSSIVNIAQGKEFDSIFRKKKSDKIFQLLKEDNLKLSYKDTNLVGKSFQEGTFKDFRRKKRILLEMHYPKNYIFLYGIDTIGIGYFTSLSNGGIATEMNSPIVCLSPKKGIDIRYVVALLLSPKIKSYILSLCNNEVSNRTLPYVMDKIIIPYHNEKEQLKFLAEANYDAMLASQEELKKNNEDYKKGVRMRKHAITQSMSSIESMFNALNSYRKRQDGSISSSDRISRITETTVDDAFNFLEERIKYIMPAIEHLADVEYSFGNAENIDPEEFISSYISRNKGGWTKFAVIMNSNDNYVTTYRPIPKSNSVKIQNEDAEPLLIPKLYFPKSALERIFNNIFSNAQSHGFTDKNRSDYKIRISWLYDGINLKIEIENNGQPLPDDRPISSLFEYGVSNSLHKDGHNGIGLNEIEEIMNRFDGKVNIVSSPIEDFTVKYILTFPTNMVPIKDITFAERTNNKA